MKTRLTPLILLYILLSQGCMVFPLEQTQSERSLYWCPPLPNCASTEAVTFVHSVQPFELNMPLDDAWPIVRESVSELKGAEIKVEYPGYIYAKVYSSVFKFLDYVEVLAVPEENRLNVRSSSLLGITDFFVNYFRVEQLRKKLKEKGAVK